MRIGELKHLVSLQKRSVTRGAAGEVVETWATIGTAWAAMKPLKGREYFAAKQVQAETTHEITIRYRSDMGPLDRITYKNRVFDIQTAINSMEQDRWLILICAEKI